ncbi:MAG: hypothetical protein ACOH5I_01510 [Oligoflexus sp.]
MMMRWIVQGLFYLLLFEALFNYLTDLQNMVDDTASIWRDDYEMHFCARYLAWEKNWQASLDWLVALEMDGAWQENAVAVARNLQEKQRLQWNPELLEQCEAMSHHFELYFQTHPELVRPYPNWSIRYLGDVH